jgi:putative PIN family toxin of toxin-antitoxin system
MKVVLDTNVLLMILPKASKYRLAFDALLDEKYKLAISNEILFEYTEILERKTNITIANNVADLLNILPNVEKVIPYFNWQFIEKDPDDNKFVDCAISARAHFIVSNDSAFNILKKIPLFKLDVITIDDFIQELKHL